MANAWVKLALAMEEVELVGLVDLNRAAAEAMAQRHNQPVSLVFDSLDAALASARPDIVFDVTVPAAHDKVTITALRGGCHVLGEKPMSDTLDKARKMVAAAKESGKLYAVTQTRRPNSALHTAISALRQGAIGQLEEIHSDFYIGAHFGGFRDEMDYPLILDMAIHTFDNARQIADADPVSVYCHSWNPPHSWYKGDASALCVFDMADADGNRIVYTYRGSWCNEGMQTSWNADWRIVGSKGTLRWDGEQTVRAEAVKADGKHGFNSEMAAAPIEPVALPYTGHEAMLRDFVHAVRNGGTPMCPCQDNIKSLAMVLAAVQSAKSGQRVAVQW